MKDYDEWKKKLFERVRSEIYSDIDFNNFSSQIDEFVYVFGEGGIKDGRMPPHGRYEIWLPNKLEHEIMKQYKEAAIKEGLIQNEQEQKNYP